VPTARDSGRFIALNEGSFLLRLEMTSSVCFVWVTAISNRFGITIRIGMIPVLGTAITVPYLYPLVIDPRLK
jgi:hypothetical protein